MRFSSPVVCTLAVLSACAVNGSSVITAFTADPDTLQPGESTTLRWDAVNASGCVLSPGDLELPTTGSSTVTPSETTTYTLKCGRAKRTLEVVVSPVGRVTHFDVTPRTVMVDSPVHVTWQSANAQFCVLTPDQGLLPTSGAIEVVIAKATSFHMRCLNDGFNEPSESIRVTTTPATGVDMPTDLQLTPSDGALTISWQLAAGSANVFLSEDPEFVTNVTFTRQASPFTVTGLVNGTPYFVRLEGVAGTFRSLRTEPKSATPVAAPPLEDPLFAEQWHLAAINVAPVWAEGLLGDGMKVAVTDEGFDLAHEDLRLNVATLQSKDYAPIQRPWTAVHGTACAGLVGARNLNGTGIRGVAPHAQLRSFNVLQDASSLNIADAMRRDKDVLAVNTNSWGVGVGKGWLTSPDPLWLAAVEEGAVEGRQHKGVLYFFAAGNGGDASEGRFDDANFGGLSNQRFVFAVGGVDRSGRRLAFAERGANLLVVAQAGGGLVTTDVTGAWGSNTPGATDELSDRSYTRKFGGTSAATPIAAGVGALVLQARPELTYRDVRRVLAKSAKQCDPAHGDWQTTPAGLHVNHDYGFGLVDAAAAVALAKTIPLLGAESSVTETRTPALPIEDGTGVPTSSSITVADSGIGHLGFVQVEVTIPHTRSGDLELVLSKLGSVSSVLHPPHSCSATCTPIDGYAFGTVRHLDEPADGTWTLSVRDRVTGVSGTLDAWTLRLFGSP